MAEAVAITVIGIGGNALLESYLIDVQNTLAEMQRFLQLISLAEHGQRVEIKLMCGCRELSTFVTVQCLGLHDNAVLTSVTCASGKFDHPGRIHAAETLMKSDAAEFRKRGRDAFLMALQDPNESVRYYAALASGKEVHRDFAIEVCPKLMMMLHDPSPAICQTVVNSLGAIKGPAISNLITLLGDKDWAVRGWACAALMSIGDAVVSELEPVTSHRNFDVRRRAKGILRELHTKTLQVDTSRPLNDVHMSFFDASDDPELVDGNICKVSANFPIQQDLCYFPAPPVANGGLRIYPPTCEGFTHLFSSLRTRSKNNL